MNQTDARRALVEPAATLPKLTDVEPCLRTTIGASAMHALKDAGWLARELTTVHTRAEPEPKPEKAPKARNRAAVSDAPRVYASQYIGVSTRRGQAYLANWSLAGKGKTGPLRPATPQGERWAAIDRAKALGLDYLEMRDGTKIEYKQAEPEEMAA